MSSVETSALNFDEQSAEDVMLFLLRQAEIGEEHGDRSRPPVLEVSRVWGQAVLDVSHVARGGAVSGVRRDFDEPVIFCWDGGRFVCRFRAEWKGFADLGERRLTVAEIVAGGVAEPGDDGDWLLPIESGTRVILDTGAMMYFGRLAHPSRTLAMKIADNLDYPFMAIMGVAGFLLSMLSVIIATTPMAHATAIAEVPDHLVALTLVKPDPETPPTPKAEVKGDAGERVKRAEGTAGEPDAVKKKTRGDRVAMQRRAIDKDIAESAGILAALREGSTLADTLGESALSEDLQSGVGALNAANGVSLGNGGLGLRGSGLGQGGKAERLGGLGTHGRGGGVEGYGSGGGSLGAPPKGAGVKFGGEPLIAGPIDKSLIDAVIKRNMNQIRYCYQRELTKDPNLSGKITVKFVIARDGSVSKAEKKSSTMGNESVESCINSRFLTFQFPEPKGGGLVIVSYPFMFAPG